MEFINYFLVFRLLVGLILGLWIIRKIRGPLRALIVRAMPVHQRISSNSFNIQTRFSTLISFLLVIVIIFLVDWGIREATSKTFGNPAVEQTEKMEFSLPPVDFNLPPQQETNEQISSSPSSSLEAPESIPKSMSKPISLSDRYYLQVYAFISQERAIIQIPVLEKITGREVWLSEVQGASVPYKVIIGPFHDRAEVIRFRQQKKIEGFPRTGNGLIIYDR